MNVWAGRSLPAGLSARHKLLSMTIEQFRARASRWLRLWFWDAVEQTAAPLTDSAALLAYIGTMVLVAVLGPRWGPDRQVDAAISATQAIIVFLWSLPVFFAVNLVRAIFRIRQRERALGAWLGDRFVYHEPRLALMVLVNEQDNARAHRFRLPDLPVDAFVWYEIATDRHDDRLACSLSFSFEHAEAVERGRNLTRGAMRISGNGMLSLVTKAQPSSTLSTVRVYVTAWGVGKDFAM